MRKTLIFLTIVIILFYFLGKLIIKDEVVTISNNVGNLELPKINKNDITVRHTYYTLCYDEENEIPKWVAHILTKDRVVREVVGREKYFYEDPLLPTKSALPEDYKGSGYDRGHMLPAGDMKWDKRAMYETFYMSNIVPQAKKMNSGIWNELEQKIRQWAKLYDTLYIVTGPILIKNKYFKIGKVNKVAVPNYLFKTILRRKGNELDAIAFIIPNNDFVANKNYRNFIYPVDSVQIKTGLDLFYRLPDSVENIIESRVVLSNWPK